ncbi:MAG: FKBP-type peptidyl-prolyl cis-trans isomerase [Lachnospiraceae bacterium]|nr:FKBP-type peptidyl-prolyl cis-trans isomerase [Lachnospiraceae bacterium]
MRKNYKTRFMIPVLAGVMLFGACGSTGEQEPAGQGAVSQYASIMDPVATGDVVTIFDYDMTQYVAVGDYLNLDVVYSETEITDDVVDMAYVNFLSDYAEAVDPSYYETGREVRLGDVVSLDFCGKRDGVAFEGGTATGYILEIGSGTFIPGFEDGLVGVMPGEEIDLDLSFPDTYQNAELAGQAVVFTCTVQGIITIDSIIATANDNLEPGQAAINTEEDLRELCREELNKQSREYAESDLENQILTNLPNVVTEIQDIPQDLKDAYDSLTLQSITNMAIYYYQMDPETLCSYYGMTLEDYIAMYSYPQLLSDSALYVIAVENGILPDEAEFQQLMQDYIAEAGVPEEQLFEQLTEEQYRVYFLEEKVMDFLMDHYRQNQ